MTMITNRCEILFLYDIENANPNGDPNDENKPRIDEETGKNIVTDVRLKRTIRDYIFENGDDIFVQEKTSDDEGHIQTGKQRALDYLNNVDSLEDKKTEQQKKIIADNVLNQCIDVRLFGATIPIELKSKKKKKNNEAETEDKAEKGSITFTGPVQFRMGKSLHAVKTMFVKGTGAFASKEGATQKTFREEYVLPYSLIGFYGIVNENAARHTRLTVNDVAKMKKAMWNGTKGLISRSKFGQMPRLLLTIEYKEPNFFIGELDNRVRLKTDILDSKIRKPEDFAVDLTELLALVETYKDKIKKIGYVTDSKMTFVQNGNDFDFNTSPLFVDESAEVL